MHILVVDDDALAGELTQAILEEIGYRSFYVENAIEALEILGTNCDFEMVISDLNMPFLNGIELFREIRAHGLKIPFILLSGDDPNIAKAEEADLDACLLKDFLLDESLPATIKKVLEHYKRL